MATYLNTLKTNGVQTLKNTVIDTIGLTAANWCGDRFVDSITTFTTTSPFVGGVMGLATNGADLAAKVLSTTYADNEGWKGTILRTLVLGGTISATILVALNLAGRVGIYISKEMMLRFWLTAILEQILRRGILPAVSERTAVSVRINPPVKKIDPPNEPINYATLTADEVKNVEKYSDGLILEMIAYIRTHPVVAHSDVLKVIERRAHPKNNKVAHETGVKRIEAEAAQSREDADKATALTKDAFNALSGLREAVVAARSVAAALPEDATGDIRSAKITDALKLHAKATKRHQQLKQESDNLEVKALRDKNTANEAREQFNKKYPVAVKP